MSEAQGRRSKVKVTMLNNVIFTFTKKRLKVTRGQGQRVGVKGQGQYECKRKAGGLTPMSSRFIS